MVAAVFVALLEVLRVTIFPQYFIICSRLLSNILNTNSVCYNGIIETKFE